VQADERGSTPTKLERHLPGVAALRTYKPAWLRSDLVAGVVLAAILVPQGMAYAELAGLPPVNGLYTTIACLVGYALTGPSKILVLGPDSSLGPLIFAAITPLVVAGDDPSKAIALAGMLAVLVGLIEIGLGVGKLGFVADLLSSEVQVGYMNGLAITIIVGQLPKLFGYSTDADNFLDELRTFVEGLDQTNVRALLGETVVVYLEHVGRASVVCMEAAACRRKDQECWRFSRGPGKTNSATNVDSNVDCAYASAWRHTQNTP
jgi:MFS superfamily sulfate permease-like transporter